jgi:hypothetical protein
VSRLWAAAATAATGAAHDDMVKAERRISAMGNTFACCHCTPCTPYHNTKINHEAALGCFALARASQHSSEKSQRSSRACVWKKKKKGLRTQLRCQRFMVGEAVRSHCKGIDLLWRKLQLSCLLGAEVRYFLDHFCMEIRGRCCGG